MTPKPFAPFLSFFLVANVLDIVTTVIGVQRGLPEGNPVMALILAHYGLVAMDAAKVGLVGAIAWTLWFLPRRSRRYRFVPLIYDLVIMAAVMLKLPTIGGLG